MTKDFDIAKLYEADYFPAVKFFGVNKNSPPRSPSLTRSFERNLEDALADALEDKKMYGNDIPNYTGGLVIDLLNERKKSDLVDEKEKPKKNRIKMEVKHEEFPEAGMINDVHELTDENFDKIVLRSEDM